MKLGVFVLIFGMLFLVGCDDGGPVIPTEDPPLAPDTEDKLMENFEDIYNGMNLRDFQEMLHQDFRLILLTQTCSDWGWESGMSFDRDDLIIIHEHMFGGSPGTDHDGNGVNPLDRIEISVFERIGPWATVDMNDVDFPGTRRALYEIKMFFHDNTGTHAFALDSQMIFYASSIDGIWYLRGIRSLSNKVGMNASYDSILSLYR